MRGLVAVWGKMQGYIGSLPDLTAPDTLGGSTESMALPVGREDDLPGPDERPSSSEDSGDR